MGTGFAANHPRPSPGLSPQRGGERGRRECAGNAISPAAAKEGCRAGHDCSPVASNSALASAICGNSGVGEKPASAGPSTSWASIGRPVDR